MNCRVLSTLFIRANGDIACDCSIGREITLGMVEPSDEWSIEGILNNEKYQHIRKSLSNGIPPWKDVCPECSLFNPAELLVDNLKNKQIPLLHFEPSLQCNLACPICYRPREMKERHGPHFMDLKVFERVLKSCKEGGFKVDLIMYQGNGDPLCHPNFSEFVKLARLIMPETKQALGTNGNFDYKSSLKDQYVDQITVSCDGLYQSSYEKYRIKGSVSKAQKFMADAKAMSPPEKSIVIWKYILFEFNDSDEELIAAQKKAVELGVDSLNFSITYSKYKSQRYNIENRHKIPLIIPIANVSSMDKITRITQVGKPLSSKDIKDLYFSFSRLVFGKTYCAIDKVFISDNNLINIQGWAMGKKYQNIKHILVYCDDQLIGDADLGIPRPDVNSAYPKLGQYKPGFNLTKRLNKPLNSPTKIMLQITTNEETTESFTMKYLFA